MRNQSENQQPNTTEAGEIRPERQYIITHLTRFLGDHYLWYIAVFAAFLSIFSFIPFFASLFDITLSNGWDSPYYMPLYRVIFVVLAAIIAWRFGTRRGMIGAAVISVVILLPSIFGLRTGSLFLDTGVVLLGLAGSAIIGREGNLQRALFRATSDLKNQTKQLKLEIDEREKDEIEIRKLSLGAIESLVFALEAKDRYTAGHSRRVAVIAVTIGNKLNLSHQEIEDLAYGSLLHDVGKIAVDSLVQNKPGGLTKGEYAQIMIHVQTGADIVKPIVNDNVVALIEHHHDHYNNADKQQTATGDAIPLGARIIAVADALDAMTSDRPYRAAMPTAEALEELRSHAGTQFDPVVVKAFLAIPLAEISIILQNKPKPVI